MNASMEVGAESLVFFLHSGEGVVVGERLAQVLSEV